MILAPGGAGGLFTVAANQPMLSRSVIPLLNDTDIKVMSNITTEHSLDLEQSWCCYNASIHSGLAINDWVTFLDT